MFYACMVMGREDAMPEFAVLQQNAKAMPERLDEIDSTRSSLFDLFISCLPNIATQVALKDAEIIGLIAESLERKHSGSLMQFATDSIKPPIKTQQELIAFKKKVLIGIYIKAWSNYNSSLLYYLNKPFIEVLLSDLGVSSINELSAELVDSSLLALSQYSSFIYNMRLDAFFGPLNEALGVAIQAQINSLRHTFSTKKATIDRTADWQWADVYWADSSKRHVELFQEAMVNDHFFSTINATELNQKEFFQLIEDNAFSNDDVLKLINLVPDTQVRSLLIIYLLSKADYYTHLKGESILDRLSNNKIHLPSRLNSLVHLIDVRVLTVDIIAKLEPEAAVSLLFSVPHFHQLQTNQVKALLKKFPRIEVLRYWVHHFHTAPNSGVLLANILKCVKSSLIDEIKKMDLKSKSMLARQVLNNIALFRSDPAIYDLFAEEEYLNIAIKMFLNGNKHESLIGYINSTLTALMRKQHHFTVDSVHLLIALNAKDEFMSLNDEYKYVQHVMKYCLNAKHALVQVIDHFIKQLKVDDRQHALHLLTAVMDRKDADAEVKDALFSSLLQFPELLDDRLKTFMLEHDAVRFIQYFGHMGSDEEYQRVIDLCQWAITNLDKQKHAQIIEITQTAYAEAVQELSFSTDTNSLSLTFHRLMRCWYYGWQGFFTPNTPIYIAPSKVSISRNDSKIPPYLLALRATCTDKIEDRLLELTKDALKEYSLECMNTIIQVLNLYEYKQNRQQEFEIRKSVDELFCQLVSGATDNQALYTWYMQNQIVINANRHRLVELLFQKNGLQEVKDMLKQSTLPFASLQSLDDELNTSPLPSGEAGAEYELAGKGGGSLGSGNPGFVQTVSLYAHNIMSFFSAKQAPAVSAPHVVNQFVQ